MDIPSDIDVSYGIISDHAVLSGLTSHIKSVRVKSRRPELYLAEERIILGGHEYLCMVRHCCIPYTHEYTIVGGDAKGSHVTERFESIPLGTRIMAAIHWKGGIRGMLGRGSIRDDYADMLAAAHAS